MATPTHPPAPDLRGLQQALDAVLEALQNEHGRLLERDVEALEASTQRKSAALAALARFPTRAFTDPAVVDRVMQCRGLNARNAALLTVRTQAMSGLAASTPAIPAGYGRYGTPNPPTAVVRHSFGHV